MAVRGECSGQADRFVRGGKPTPNGRNANVYGRKLSVLSRDGSSAVDALVAEGVAGQSGTAGKAGC